MAGCGGLDMPRLSTTPTTEQSTYLREEGGIRDELENQIITGSDINFISEVQRKIGDEFYEDDISNYSKSPIAESPSKSPASDCSSYELREDSENICINLFCADSPLKNTEDGRAESLITAEKPSELDPEKGLKAEKQDKPAYLDLKLGADKPVIKYTHPPSPTQPTKPTPSSEDTQDTTQPRILSSSSTLVSETLCESSKQDQDTIRSFSLTPLIKTKSEDINLPSQYKSETPTSAPVSAQSLAVTSSTASLKAPVPSTHKARAPVAHPSPVLTNAQTPSSSPALATSPGQASVVESEVSVSEPDKLSEAFDSVVKEEAELFLQKNLEFEHQDENQVVELYKDKQNVEIDVRTVVSFSSYPSVSCLPPTTSYTSISCLPTTYSLSLKEYEDRDLNKSVESSPELAVAAFESLREPGGLHSDLFSDGLGSHSQEVRVYSGDGDLHQLLSVSHIMTATTNATLESVLEVGGLDAGLVKTEPEDLTGRHRHDTESSLPLDVTTKAMGIVSQDGDSIILNPDDLPLAPGFSSTTLSSYDSTPFSSSYNVSEHSRIYDSPYREDSLYDGYRAPNSSYFVSGSGTPGLSVDLPSPDSGIGPDQITPRELGSDYDYSTQNILDQNTIRRPWHDYGRGNSETEKVQISKVYSPYGFKYYLDAPTSSSVRREDDKVTYINKGQFYGVTLEYIRDPDYHLKSTTVKSVIMLVFREGKSQEDEIKAWQFWHQRQHSVKQRIIDVDTKNSHALVGPIEELSHNAIAVYWNPLESFAKVNLAVQCLSTDFSTQKGVKGLPLHIQIDTYEDPRQEVGSPAIHRGYSQVKIFCDKGAERKLRDEERRAAKRRMTPSGKRRLDEMYHETFERSDFYSMSDLNKPPTLFTPPEDPDKSSQMCQDFPSFYTRSLEPSKPVINGDILPSIHLPVCSPEPVSLPEKTVLVCNPFSEKPKRARLIPPSNERIMIYVRQETEDVYTPLHLVPPTVAGLIQAIENKYKINATNIRYIYRKNRDRIVAKIDDDMLRHYCNEDVFLMQVMVTEGPGGEDSMVYDITLSEIQGAMEH